MGIFKALFGGLGGLGAGELSRRLGIVEKDLRDLRPTYTSFTIPKRTGGAREILAPAENLKVVQRLILARLLGRLAIHPAAKGFRPGESIVGNAAPHAGKAVVVRMDLKDFFSSTKSRRIESYFRKIGWNSDSARVLTNLCTWKGALPQGAPTSPCLSNLVNYRLDARLSGLAKKYSAAYSRYADDLIFSFAKDERNAVQAVIYATKLIVAEEGYELHQSKKLRIRRKHQQQLVTGLVVNQSINLPRKTRRWLRAIEHRQKTGRAATLTPAQLEGWRALRKMIAPNER